MCAVFHTNFISYVVVVVVVSLTEEIINFDSKQFCTQVEEKTECLFEFIECSLQQTH